MGLSGSSCSTTIAMAPRMDKVLGIDVFSYLTLGLIMISTKYELLTKFLKMKPPTF